MVLWTPDRLAAVGLGTALLASLYVFFFGKRPGASASVSGALPREVTIVVEGGYSPEMILAQRGVPLKLVFDRRESSACTDEVVLPEFGIRKALPSGAKTEVEIVPERTGEFPFSCGMNMLHGKIKVVEG